MSQVRSASWRSAVPRRSAGPARRTETVPTSVPLARNASTSRMTNVWDTAG